MTKEERARLRELERAATPGPWYFDQGTDYRDCLDKPLHWWIVRSSADGCNRFELRTLAHDANDEYANRRWPEILGFVIAARNDTAALLDALDAAEERAEKAEAALARERGVSEALIAAICAWYGGEGLGCPPAPWDHNCAEDLRCDDCWRAWAESEADKGGERERSLLCPKCGNRDSVPMELAATQPCSAGCGGIMVEVDGGGK